MRLKLEIYATISALTIVLITAIVASTNIKVDSNVQTASLIDGRTAKQVESHYNDQFPGRSVFVNFWGAVQYTLFNDGRDGVQIGHQGWLFSEEEYTWTEQSSKTLQNNLFTIAQVTKFLERHGIEASVLLIPEKVSIYPQYMRKHSQHLKERLHERTVQGLKQLQVRFVDPSNALIESSQSELTYLRTDTHWTPAGAQIVANEIALQNSKWLGTQDYKSESGNQTVHRGDLLNFVPVSPYLEEFGPKADQLSQYQTELLGGVTDSLFGDGQTTELALVGTSYSADENWHFQGFLKSALKQDLYDFSTQGEGPFKPMQSLLDDVDGNLAGVNYLIWEIPVRYLATKSSAPLFEQLKTQLPNSWAN